MWRLSEEPSSSQLKIVEVTSIEEIEIVGVKPAPRPSNPTRNTEQFVVFYKL